MKRKVLDLFQTIYKGCNHQHFSLLPVEREEINLSRSSVRCIVLEAGIKSPRNPRKRRAQKHHSRRKRYPGEGMECKTLFEKLRNLGYGLPRELALFLPVILYAISTDWLLQTDNNSLAYYILPTFS